MTGITRVSKESVFSDLNHIEIVTTTSVKYADSFGFTEEEVFATMDEYGYADKQLVKKWYDGFTFGTKRDIYNPWSILNYLDKGKIDLYWTNTSSNHLVSNWFSQAEDDYNDFIRALLQGYVNRMNLYMNQVALTTFSFFDTGRNPSNKLNPEIFYHGLVLGLLVELRETYSLTSNRESGYGRYDVMLEPKKSGSDAIIIEFKVQDGRKENSLSDTVATALAQIEEKKYEAILVEKGISREKIRKYGFAFAGKRVLIG